ATTWNWYSGSCGGTPVGTGTSINVSPSVNTTYFVRGEGGCITPGACAQMIITVNPLPVAVITGPLDICPGTSGVTYTGNAGMAQYLWSIAGNGSINGANNASSVDIDVSGIGSFTLTLQITDANGCTDSESIIVDISDAA